MEDVVPERHQKNDKNANLDDEGFSGDEAFGHFPPSRAIKGLSRIGLTSYCEVMKLGDPDP